MLDFVLWDCFFFDKRLNISVELEMLECFVGGQWVPSTVGSDSDDLVRSLVDSCVRFAVGDVGSCCWEADQVYDDDDDDDDGFNGDVRRILQSELHELPKSCCRFVENDERQMAHRQDGALKALYRRYARLVCVVEAMERDHDEFATIDAEETGVPVAITKQVALGYGPAARAFLLSGLRFLECRLQEDGAIPGRYGSPIVRVCKPISPAVIIAPWNVPFGTVLPKLFVAWLCGCSVIVKPSEYASRGICAMIRKLTDAVWPSAPLRKLMPTGAVQVLCGGPAVGVALTHHPDVRCVQFTGASSTAAKVAAVCSKFLRPFHAECGGSNAAIVTESSNLDLAVRCIAMGMTTLNGQWCMGLTRVLVHESITNTFLHKLVSFMNEHVRVVDPVRAVGGGAPSSSHGANAEEPILVGRLAYVEHADKLRQLCDQCQPSSVLLLGEMSEDLAATSPCYFQPRLLVDPDVAVISSQELFGPAAGLIRFQSIDDAIRVVNTSTGQLACYVFGDDTDALYKLAPRINTGMVMINSVNFCFEVADGHAEPLVDFVGTAGHGADGNGAALAEFFTSSMWVGVNGPQSTS